MTVTEMQYGGRGLTVCEEWLSFENFYKWAMENGYADGLTIEREDNDKGYSPDNCHWATREEQNRNTSRTHRIKDGNRIITAAQAAETVGVSRSVVAEWCRDGKVETLDDVIRLEKNINNGRHIRC